MKGWRWHWPCTRRGMTTGASCLARWIALRRSRRQMSGAWRTRRLCPRIARLGSLSLPDRLQMARPLRREVDSEAHSVPFFILIFSVFFSPSACRSCVDRLPRLPRWPARLGADYELETDSDSEAACL